MRESSGRLRRAEIGLAIAFLLAGAMAGCSGSAPHAAPGRRGARFRLASDGVTRNALPPGATAIGIAADAATGGYWILLSNGGIIAASAPWHGSLAGKVPAGSVVTALAAGSDGGYLILTSRGGVYPFGTKGYGSDAGKLPAGVEATGIATDPVTGGYWVLRSDGVVDGFHAPRLGSLAGKVPAGATAAAIAAGTKGGYRILTAKGGAVPADLAGRVWDVIPTSRKVVAITVDVGPTDGVPKMLATLRRDHVQATFNVVGRVAREHPATVRAIAAAGQLIGDHSNNHPRFTKISDRRMRSEVLDARTTIESLTGLDVWPWFRFPFGDDNANAIAVVNSTGFVPIGWTVDTLGWEGTSGGVTVQEVVDRVLAARRPGEIVLMHGGADAPDDHSTLDADALPIVIRKLRADGYSFVTLDALRGFGAAVGPANGAVRSFGARSFGSDGGKLAPEVTAVGLAADPATDGYWIGLSTGRIDGFHAPELGGLAGKIPAGAVVTGIAAGPDGSCLVLTSDGTVHRFTPKP